MKELGGVLLALGSVMSYFIVATRLAFYQRWPVLHFLGLILACVLLAWVAKNRKGLRRWVAGAALLFAVGLTGLFAWYTLDYSVYASTASAFADGQDLTDQLDGWSLVSHTGESRPVAAPEPTLLVFYRGFW